MYCHEVWVASNAYKAGTPLWYLFKKQLAPGTIVHVSLRKKNVLGFIGEPTGAKCTISQSKLATGYPIDDISGLPGYQLQLHKWMLEYYGNPSGTTTSLFLPAHLESNKKFSHNGAARQESFRRIHLPPLTKDQSSAIRAIKSKNNGTIVLHGVTGSGKTRIYTELASEALNNNKSVIILTPEIGLSAQLETDIAASLDRFPIIRSNSKQSPSVRKAIWLQCLMATQPQVVVGPRSALFLPLHNNGLIIIDEEHDDSYKQSQSPYYHSVRVAAKLCTITRTNLLLGSATPSVTDYYLAETKGRPIITLTKTALKSSPASIEIIDLGDKEQFVRSKFIAEKILQSIEKCLANNKQVLLFLNRRGSSRLIACTQCQWEAICDKCSLPYTYHNSGNLLRCHTCGRTCHVPLSCPECMSVEILYSIPGTERIIGEMNRLFPHKTIARFDSDTKDKESLEKNIEFIKTKQIDIIVGTQMLIKGFDLPHLQLVGIINADTSLAFPDYTSEEKMYQLLVQAMGRVNRGHNKGRVLIQTRQPKSTVLHNAIGLQWNEFYQDQIRQRRQYYLPPFCHVMKLQCKRSSSQSSAKSATQLKEKLIQLFPSVTILGPAPSFKPKVNNQYAWQLVIKSGSRQNLTNIITMLPSGWSYDIDPISLL